MRTRWNEKESLIRIAIVGGGPAGLSLALALAKRKECEVQIFEKSPDPRSLSSYNPLRSYTIDITGHGAKAIRYLGIESSFDSSLIPFHGIRLPILHKNLVEPYLGLGWTGSRGDIVKVLLEEWEKATSGNPLHSIHFNKEAKLTDADQGKITIGEDKNQLFFDLIVCCDGAGSQSRQRLSEFSQAFQVHSLDNENHSFMVAMDQNTSNLDPSYLYIFGLPPYLAVAGAINGPAGPKDPLWFCQLGFSGVRKLNSRKEAQEFLDRNFPKRKSLGLAHFISEKALDGLVGQECISTGKAKICSSFHLGKVVLLGDSAAPFPPVGQGVNAALEMAMVLDQSLGLAFEDSKLQSKKDVIDKTIQTYEYKAKPESDAIRKISFHGLNLKSYESRLFGKPKLFANVLLHKLFHRDPMTNAKREDMSYAEALQRKKTIDLALWIGLGLALGVALFRQFT